MKTISVEFYIDLISNGEEIREIVEVDIEDTDPYGFYTEENQIEAAFEVWQSDKLDSGWNII